MSKKKKPVSKPRDPFVQHLIVKKQGAHVKPYKAQRQKNKAELRKGDSALSDSNK